MSDKEPVAATHKHKFRYLLPPGNNFAFVAKFRIWLIVSVLLMAVSISILFVNKSVRGEYMNWTIDFKGGTEIIYAFKDKATKEFVKVDPGKVRESLAKAGEADLDVSDISWEEGSKHIDGKLIKSPRFTALKKESETKAFNDFLAKFKANDPDLRITWSGDRLYTHGKKLISQADAAPIFTA